VESATGIYRKPSATVLVYGDITPGVVERLKSLLRIHGSRGLRIIIAPHNTPRVLESLRTFLQDNYTFTVEVYTRSTGFREAESPDGTRDVVAVLVSSSELVKSVPSSLQDRVVVVT
jgi:hypothetical protein